jgi:hypothetical protein
MIGFTMPLNIFVERQVAGPGSRHRLDRICRWLFPLAYILGLGFVLGFGLT